MPSGSLRPLFPSLSAREDGADDAALASAPELERLLAVLDAAGIGGGGALIEVGSALVGPDQTGNARGADAIDIQTTRSAVTEVASGSLSVAIGTRVTAAAANAVGIGRQVTLAAGNGRQVAVGNAIVTNGGGDVLLGKDLTANNNAMAAGISDNAILGFSVRLDYAVDCYVGGCFIDLRGYDATDAWSSCLLMGENLDWDLGAGGAMASCSVIGTSIIPAAPTTAPVLAGFIAGADFDPTPYLPDIAFGGWIIGANFGAAGGVFLVADAQARYSRFVGLEWGPYTDGEAALGDATHGWKQLHVANSGYATAPLRLGAYYLWVDTSGRLRIKNGAPSSATDGTIVGTQV